MKRINVTRSSMPSFEEYCEAIKPIFESRHLTNMGPVHNELEKRLCEYLGCENISLFTNGHLALEAALKAMDLKGEVITTPFTFASTTHAIVRCGLKPVFCDVEPNTYTMDASKIETLITENTSAILPVHVYGSVCDVEAIEKIAGKYGLKVIYDAAHAFGVEINGRPVASYGDASMFSFHATKVFNTIEGGCLVFKDATLAQKLQYQKNFGTKAADVYAEIGGNAKMNEFQAAMGICNLRYVDGEILKRKAAVERYAERLSGIDGIKIWSGQENVKCNYAYFPVVFDKSVFGKSRDEVSDALNRNNIFARKYFYPLITDFDCYSSEYDSSQTPVAKNVSDNVLTLPLYADLTVEDVDMICDIILG